MKLIDALNLKELMMIRKSLISRERRRALYTTISSLKDMPIGTASQGIAETVFWKELRIYIMILKWKSGPT